MCLPPAALALATAATTAAGTYVNASSNRRATNDANRRQGLQIQQSINDNQHQFNQDNQRANLEFQNVRESAERANEIEERQRIGEQQALEPIDRLENFQQNLDQHTNEQRQVFADDLDESIKSGNQNIGSGIEGNVSEAFTSASNDAQQNSLERAGLQGDQRARVSAASGLLQDDANAVQQAGQQTSATNFAIQRQREIDEFLRRLGSNRADVQSRRAPLPVTVI